MQEAPVSFPNVTPRKRMEAEMLMLEEDDIQTLILMEDVCHE